MGVHLDPATRKVTMGDESEGQPRSAVLYKGYCIRPLVGQEEQGMWRGAALVLTISNVVESPLLPTPQSFLDEDSACVAAILRGISWIDARMN